MRRASSILRVFQATPGYAPAYGLGGPTQSLEGLNDRLVELGVHVRVLTTDCAGDARLSVPGGWQTWRGVPVRYLRRWMPPDVTPAYLPIALAESRRADVVHITGLFSLPSMQGVAAALAAGKPTVLSTRGVLDPGSLAFGRTRLKRAWLSASLPLLKRVDIFHATSREEQMAVHAALGPLVDVRVVPNGVELPDEPAQRSYGPVPVIGFLGRIHRVKALERLLDAASLLLARRVEFDLQLAGPTPDSSYTQELLQQVARHGLERHVTFLGELRGPAKRAFYESCRVFVLPSSTENFGNVVPEALSHGVPVIASRFTPWAELEDASCGRWVENSPEALAAAAEPYLRDENLSVEEGIRGRRLVERKYTWKAVARQMMETYLAAIGQHGGRS